MELEKIATNAVETSIVKTDRLTSFINRGDKEPCWDGNIYIHESKVHSKKNIKKVATQVKGKAVVGSQVTEVIEYRISRDDLVAYMMNGGTMFFVVYIEKVTGNPLQIYYTELLPIKLKEILKKEQKSYKIRLVRFPDDNAEKTAVFEKFHGDAQRQASFAGQDLPTIEELEKKGILESLVFHCTGYGNYRSPISVPKIMDGKSLSIYATVKGCSCPVPVEYIESIQCVTMSSRNTSPITVDGVQYYSGFNEITTAESIELRIGSCVKIVFPNVGDESQPVSPTISIKVQGTLKQQIDGIEFINAIREHKKFSIGDIEIPANFPETELKKIGAESFERVLAGYKRIQALLDNMNVKKDLDIQKCEESDFAKLNLLIATICDKKPVREGPSTRANVQEFSIANLLLAVVYLKRTGGGYHIFDYFGNHFEVSYGPNGSAPVPVSQFFSMGPDDFLRFDNINLETIVKDFKRLKASESHITDANNTMLCMLKAYDKKALPELLAAARQLSDWVQEFPEFISHEITVLNRLQIVLRERPLTYSEKAEIYSILNEDTDPFVRIGGFLLLDEQQEANDLLKTLDEEQLERFKAFPIYKFCRSTEEEPDNG